MYENEQSPDLPPEEFVGRVLKVGPYNPPALLIKFGGRLDTGETWTDTMHFHNRQEFDHCAQIIE
jgi:hypothetical protein